MKEVTRWGSSIARVPKNSLLHIRATLVGIWQRLSWRVTLLFRTIGKSCCSIEDVLSMSLGSLTQDSLLEDEKVKKEDSLSSSLKPFGDHPDEELSDDLPKPRKVHYHSTWKNTQDAAYWINFVRAQDKGLRFWQTRSQAEIVHNSVPTDCIDKVIPQKGERTLFERLSTPRPAPKIVIKSAWQSQRQDSERGSTRTKKLVRRVQREERERINGIQKRTQNHDAKGNWSEVLLLRKKSLNSKSKSELKELHKDVILKDEEQMGKTTQVLVKLRNGSRPKSIRQDLETQKKSYDVQRRITSRDSRDGRPVSFLLEAPARGAQILWLWRLSPTRWSHSKQNQNQIPSFDSAVLSCTSESFKRQEVREVSMAKRHWKAMDAKKGANKRDKDTTILIRWQQDEKYWISQLAHGWTEDYCLYLDCVTTIDISDFAPYHQRYRCENTITMRCNDTSRQAGPMKARKDYQLTTRVFEGLREEQRPQISFIPKKERTRQRPFNEEPQAKLKW